ncbi:DUF1660 family phage protein [Pedobacter sp.]
MIISQINRLLCKVFGHKFEWYIRTHMQEAPRHFYCKRCCCIVLHNR